jgi:predicted nucleotidyltransferase
MRFTQKKLLNHIQRFLLALEGEGYAFNKVILFGSYSNGYPHELSDIDLAIWSPQFSDDPYESKEKIRSLLQSYTPIQLHPYASGETAQTDPFIAEIERTGKEVIR